MRRLKRYAQRGPARNIWRAINQLSDIVTANELRPSNTISVDRTTAGTIAKVRRQLKAAEVDEHNVKLFSISSIQATYLTCDELDVAGLSGGSGIANPLTNVSVLRPYWLGLVADSDTVSFSSDGQDREIREQHSYGGELKYFHIAEEVYPKYTVNNIIAAAYIKTHGLTDTDGDGNKIEWIDLNMEARVWRKKSYPVVICVGGEDKIVLMPRGRIHNGSDFRVEDEPG